jgi:hypothetical protein
MPGDSDFDFEPAPGLPAPLPKGETILWQGRPAVLPLAREALGLNWIAGYFVLLALWRGIVAGGEGGLPVAVPVAISYVMLGLAACAIILAIAWAQARATVYTITTARVLMRVGAALSVTFNIPFTQVAGASLDLRRGGHGTVALATGGDTRLSYLVLWPHVRPWRARHTEPALRCIPDAALVAQILADAAETRLNMPVVGPVGALPAAMPAE